MSFGRHLIPVGRTVFLPFTLKLNQNYEINFLHNVRTLIIRYSVKNTEKLSLTPKHSCMCPNHTFKKSGCDFLPLTFSSTFSTFDDVSGRVIKHRKKMGALKTNAKRDDWRKSEKLIANIISEKGNDKWEHDDWIELSKTFSGFVSGSWELMCMIHFFHTSNLALACSLMDFMLSKQEEPSRLFVTYFIGLLGATSDGDSAQEDKMKVYYDDLISKSDLLDSLTMEVLAKGLSHTRYYKDCLELVSKAKITNTLSTTLLVNTLLGGLRNNDNELCTYALDHFNDPTSSGLFLQLFHKIVDQALECGNKEGLQLFFSFIELQGLTPQKSELQAVMESFQNYEPGQWEGHFGHVNHITGRCSVCRQSMKEVVVSDEDFRAVQSAFLDQVIVSDNIFYKSSPDEVQSFISFVAENGPFDVVIDGLNVLFVDAKGRRQRAPDPYMLSKIESNFTRQGLNVLILGSRYLRKALRGIIHESAVYTTATTEADDAFFLYAALHSGKNTLIVSGDKLRDHKFRLEPKLRPIFYQWLKSAQVFDFFINKRTKNMVLKSRKFNLGPVEDVSGWHLPFDDVTKFVPFGRNGVLCLRHKPEKLSSDQEYNNAGWIGKARDDASKPKSDIPWYKQ